MIENYSTRAVIEALAYLNSILKENGIAVLSHTINAQHYLYTVGNTTYDCPELLLFCSNNKIEHYNNILILLSQSMRDTKKLPQPHQKMTFQKCKFYPISMDYPCIAGYANMVLFHYKYRTDIVMLQLMTTDLNGKYPHELDYDHKYIKQPVLKTQ